MQTLPAIFYLYLFSFLFIILLLIYYFRYSKDRKKSAGGAPHFSLVRSDRNPLIVPSEHYNWESECTFNPAVIRDDDGTIHLFYRAIGSDGTSKIGHSATIDGTTFLQHSPFPIYQGSFSFDRSSLSGEQIYNPSYYTSGGGWAGCEDPRAVIIDGQVYMTYVAFEGWDSIRVALTSISLENIKKEQWDWKKPIIISPLGEAHKNWVLFPEKINGKFAVLHAISPDILIDYVDDLDRLHFSPIQSRPPHDGNRNYYGRATHWDSSVRSAGAPPIKTSIGWLLLYHAMDNNDPNKYKLGAMILDINNPTKILYRSPHAILSPEYHYENDSKPGVIYASGAVIHNGDLMVYYGGGDKYVCVAKTPLSTLLDWLVAHGRV